MSWYLKKYVGTYRVKAEYDVATNDFPRNEDGSIDSTFEDIYIDCANGCKIMHYESRGSMALLQAYIPSISMAGKLDKAEKDRLRSGTPWYDDPESLPHMKMCRKTVLLQMLGDGTAPLSIEMRNALEYERAADAGEVIYADSPLIAEAEANRKAVRASDEVPQEESVIDGEAKEVTAEQPKAKRGSK